MKLVTHILVTLVLIELVEHVDGFGFGSIKKRFSNWRTDRKNRKAQKKIEQAQRKRKQNTQNRWKKVANLKNHVYVPEEFSSNPSLHDIGDNKVSGAYCVSAKLCSGTRFNHKWDEGETWMRNLDPNLLGKEVVLPGTHDSYEIVCTKL